MKNPRLLITTIKMPRYCTKKCARIAFMSDVNYCSIPCSRFFHWDNTWLQVRKRVSNRLTLKDFEWPGDESNSSVQLAILSIGIQRLCSHHVQWSKVPCEECCKIVQLIAKNDVYANKNFSVKFVDSTSLWPQNLMHAHTKLQRQRMCTQNSGIVSELLGVLILCPILTV